MSDLDPPNGYTITGEGQGGAAGFAKGGAKVRLEPADGGTATVLHYSADAQIGGKLAQIGSRLVEGTAKKLADEFFAAFAAQAAAAAPAANAHRDRPRQANRCRSRRRPSLAQPAAACPLYFGSLAWSSSSRRSWLSLHCDDADASCDAIAVGNSYTKLVQNPARA